MSGGRSAGRDKTATLPLAASDPIRDRALWRKLAARRARPPGHRSHGVFGRQFIHREAELTSLPEVFHHARCCLRRAKSGAHDVVICAAERRQKANLRACIVKHRHEITEPFAFERLDASILAPRRAFNKHILCKSSPLDVCWNRWDDVETILQDRTACMGRSKQDRRGRYGHIHRSERFDANREPIMTPPRTTFAPTSEVFDGPVGASAPAALVSKRDYLIDPNRYPSEGNWAFCRFSGQDIPAARMGFQRGGFNGGSADQAPSRSYLQLHLEFMTRDGAVLWVPSAVYPAETVLTDAQAMDITLDHGGHRIFSFRGWPKIDCHFRSADDYAQADLQFDLKAVTVLPDCVLPHCLFAMWESMGDVSGSIRYGDRTVAVTGKVFLDHTRVIPRRHSVVSRHMYIYTTLYFEDGSGLFGYHCEDARGRLIEGYCFGIFLDATGKARFLTRTELTQLAVDEDGIASAWQLRWEMVDFSVSTNIRVEHSRILKSWGTADAPQERRHYSIIPLVLNAIGTIVRGGVVQTLHGYGLAEYFNADLWPADAAAAAVDIRS